jgi:hypothetical protein
VYGEEISICLWKISEVDVGGSTRCYVWHNVISFACTRRYSFFSSWGVMNDVSTCSELQIRTC